MISANDKYKSDLLSVVRITAFVAFSFFLNSFQGAFALSERFCDLYASTSVLQNETAVAESIPDAQYPVWSSDYNHHYQWCLRKKSSRDLGNELKARDHKLRTHRTPNDCAIVLGGGGKNSPVFRTASEKLFLNLGGPWNFIRRTEGPCTFRINSYLAFGSGIKKLIRPDQLGGQGARWDAVFGEPINFDKNIVIRSVEIRKPTSTDCSITLGDEGVRQTFYGPAANLIGLINGWSFVTQTTGPCQFRVYNKSNERGKSMLYHSGINERIRVGWRVRAIEILPD